LGFPRTPFLTVEGKFPLYPQNQIGCKPRFAADLSVSNSFFAPLTLFLELYKSSENV